MGAMQFLATWWRKRGLQTVPGIVAVLLIALFQTFPIPVKIGRAHV